MKLASWNKWTHTIDRLSANEIDLEISSLEANQGVPFVEKNMKLGYLYFSKDYLGTATKVFENLVEKIKAEKNNFQFIAENEEALKAFRFSSYCIIFEILDGPCDDCGGDACAPFCGCLGILAVMAICGIESEDVFSFDSATGTSGGCIGNACEFCGKGCEEDCGY